jgi:hypothetical protein
MSPAVPTLRRSFLCAAIVRPIATIFPHSRAEPRATEDRLLYTPEQLRTGCSTHPGATGDSRTAVLSCSRPALIIPIRCHRPPRRHHAPSHPSAESEQLRTGCSTPRATGDRLLYRRTAHSRTACPRLFPPSANHFLNAAIARYLASNVFPVGSAEGEQLRTGCSTLKPRATEDRLLYTRTQSN